jgi:hypothetical protein
VPICCQRRRKCKKRGDKGIRGGDINNGRRGEGYIRERGKGKPDNIQRRRKTPQR